MKITPKLKELVKQEAKNIKKHASKAELNKLNFNGLNPVGFGGCIYGQMTGHCFSDRADYLIKKCASRIYKTYSVTDPSPKLLQQSRVTQRNQMDNYMWSPIEMFIANTPNLKDNKNLIAYLKGEKRTLSI